MNLNQAELGKEYIILDIQTGDSELEAFLFSLGCYSGEAITVVSHIKGGSVVSIKDGRYSIDKLLAEAIIVYAAFPCLHIPIYVLYKFNVFTHYVYIHMHIYVYTSIYNYE